MTQRRRKHSEVAVIGRRVVEMREATRGLPGRPTVKQIAALVGVSYYAARHYLAGETKALHALGR